MNFTEFETRLAQVMRDADLRTVVVITNTNPEALVQFLIDEIGAKGELLITQASGNHLTPTQDQQLLQAGYQLDPTMPGRLWYQETPWPASSTKLRQLATALTQTLQDRGLTTPDTLTYRAWRDPEPRPDVATGEQLDALDPGQNPLPIPTLGLNPHTPKLTNTSPNTGTSTA